MCGIAAVFGAIHWDGFSYDRIRLIWKMIILSHAGVLQPVCTKFGLGASLKKLGTLSAVYYTLRSQHPAADIWYVCVNSLLTRPLETALSFYESFCELEVIGLLGVSQQE